jgi:hypothetical protein
MTRTAAIVLGGLAVSLLAPTRPPDAVASVLCQVRRKALVVRDQCKPNEQALTPDRQAELGLVGPQGPAGPPGPATGALRVVDSAGREVGLVIRAGSYYGASAQIVGELTLPGRGGPEFVTAEVDGNGLQKANTCSDIATYFRTSTCLGQAYADCSFGDCETTPGSFFAQPLFYQSTATGCFLGDASEIEPGGSAFRRRLVRGSSVADAARSCRLAGGTMMAPATPCKPTLPLFCGQCCAPASPRTLVPTHSFDASLLGTPLFRLSQ